MEIKRIDSEVAAKLKQLEKQKENFSILALSFAWLAIIMICLLFIISLLSDLFKLVSYLKENFQYGVKKFPLSPNKEVIKERGSIFRQVFENDKKLFNHSYFQKRKNLVSW